MGPTQVWTNAAVATMAEGGKPFGLIEAGAVAVRDGRIAWVGPAADLLADRGTLAPGKRADLVLWELGHPAELPYRIAHSPVRSVVRGGAEVHRASPPDLLAA